METMVLISTEQLRTEINEAVKAALKSHLPIQEKPSEVILLSRKETAKLLGISLPTLSEWTKAGDISGYRIGASIRYKKAEVEQSLNKIRYK